MQTRYGTLRTHLEKLRKIPITDIKQMFSQWVELSESFPEPERKRLYTPSDTFWLFLSQTLTKAVSCRETVRRFLAWLAVEKGVRIPHYAHHRTVLPCHRNHARPGKRQLAHL